MGRTQLKAHKLPSGSYRVQVYLGKDENGKRIMRSFTDPDEKHVLSLAMRYLDEHRSDAVETGTFLDAMNAFLASRKPVLSPSTMRAYTTIANTLKSDYRGFCNKNMRSIKGSDIQNVINDLLLEHENRHRLQKGTKKLSPNTVRNYAGFISSVYRSKGINMPVVKLPTKERPKLNVPDEHTVKEIVAAAKGTDLEVPIQLAAFGPLRRGEICALTLQDIKGNVIHVSKDMVVDREGIWHIKTPKTYSSNRFIEMPPKVIKAIKKQGYVTKLTPKQLSDKFDDLLKGLDIEGVRFHDLRHFCVSYLHSQGVPDAYIMKRGGWSTDSTLKSVYRHTLADQDKIQTAIAIEKFNSFF